jgi:hypothetical protein
MGGVKGWVTKSCFLGNRRWRAFAKIRDFLLMEMMAHVPFFHIQCPM